MISVKYEYLITGILKDNLADNVQPSKTIHDGYYGTYTNMQHAIVNNKVIKYSMPKWLPTFSLCFLSCKSVQLDDTTLQR